MRVAVVIDDLILFSRIEAIADAAGASLVRVSDPSELPANADVVLVDWASRRDGWPERLRPYTPQRLILFGPHTDLAAHADARAAGLGPMWARSRLLRDLAGTLDGSASSADG